MISFGHVKKCYAVTIGTFMGVCNGTEYSP